MSVDHATIGQLTEQKEGTMEDTVSKDAIIAMWRQELELTYGNQITELQNKLDATNQYVESYKNKVNSLQSQVNRIIDNLTEDYWFNPNTDTETILTDICEILDYEPKKEISFTATFTVSGRYDLPMTDADGFDLEAFLADTMSIDAYNGDVVIDDWSLESVDEF